MRYSTDPKITLQQYLEQRNQVLLKGDLEGLRKFLVAKKLPCPRSKSMLEVTLHKSITAAMALPKEYRQRSKNWLTQRGLKSLDDGDLK